MNLTDRPRVNAMPKRPFFLVGCLTDLVFGRSNIRPAPCKRSQSLLMLVNTFVGKIYKKPLYEICLTAIQQSSSRYANGLHVIDRDSKLAEPERDRVGPGFEIIGGGCDTPHTPQLRPCLHKVFHNLLKHSLETEKGREKKECGERN